MYALSWDDALLERTGIIEVPKSAVSRRIMTVSEGGAAAFFELLDFLEPGQFGWHSQRFVGQRAAWATGSGDGRQHVASQQQRGW